MKTPSFSKVIVYVLTSKSSGKQYVGKTVKPLNIRWSAHCTSARKGSSFYIHRAIKKHGVEDFTKEVLAECSTDEEAFALEQAYIKSLNTRAPNGFNFTDGGEGICGHKMSQETKRKMSLSMRGLHHGFGNKNTLGLKQTEEAKHKIRLARLGKKLSEESKRKVSEARRKAGKKGQRSFIFS